MPEHFYALIMAGGGGTRLWPMSRQQTPKQLLPLIDARSMFQTSIDRLRPLFEVDHIYVIAGPEHMDALRQNAPDVPTENFIVEPHARNTAPAAALGVSVIYHRDPQATIALLTADHHIGRENDFRELLQSAYALAQKGHIVTLGIYPTFPSTGFGYIQQGPRIEVPGAHVCYEALGFTEKPDLSTAEEFLASGQYSWNSGMFVWMAECAMREFQRQQPSTYQLIQALLPSIDTPDFPGALTSIWGKMPKTSIDFAIMEGAQQMAVIPAEIGWSDVGSWMALFNIQPSDGAGNRFDHAPKRVVFDTHKTMVYSDRLVVTIGIEDIIVVDTNDVLLICQKDHAEEVKTVVQHLRDANENQYL